jgi:hypothetical protein
MHLALQALAGEILSPPLSIMITLSRAGTAAGNAIPIHNATKESFTIRFIAVPPERAST